MSLALKPNHAAVKAYYDTLHQFGQLYIDQAQTPTKGSCGMWSSSYTTNNQITGYSYDSAGNLLNDGTHSYTYDAENRITAVGGGSTATYVYDADGKRVSKILPGVESDYIFDQSGDPLAIYGDGCGASCWAVGYVYANGKLLAQYSNTPSSTTYFVLTDHLGSTRLMTAMNKSVYDSMDYMPFGEQVAGGTGSTHKFTGKERDSESGLDHFQFRKFSSAMGRFMSPDPAGMMAVDIGSPQTLNRYAYVLNNPLSFTDPFGLDCAYLNSSGTGIEKGGIDQNSSSGECGKTGGYWVEGTITQVNIDSNATTISLTGTTNGTNQTNASYQQDAVVTVGEYNNTSLNQYNHIALGLFGQTQFGQNPRSDAHFLWSLSMHGPNASVPGAIKPQVGGRLLNMARIRATGMQATMLQNAMNQSAQNPPPYTVFGQTGCDCGTWAQMMLGDAGINSGPPAPLPDNLMQQLNQLYPQAQPPQQ
ncbi:MAG: RHS repeat domain-containing protein [Candidatus Acidiferrales bacterium]